LRVTNYHTTYIARCYSKSPYVVKVEFGFIPYGFPDRTELYNIKDLVFYDDLKMKDIGFFTIPSSQPKCTNIIEYFPYLTSEIIDLITTQTKIDVILVRSGGYDDVTDSFDYTIDRKNETVSYNGTLRYVIDPDIKDPDTEESIPHPILVTSADPGLRLNALTSPGDCFAFCMCNDSSFKKFISVQNVFQNPWYFYLHMAGHTPFGYGTTLSRNEIEKVIDDNKLDRTSIRDPEDRIEEEVGKYHSIIQETLNPGLEYSKRAVFAPGHYNKNNFPWYHEVIGTMPPFKVSNSTKIKRSDLFGIFKPEYPVTRMPAKNYIRVENGITINPFVLAKELYGSNLNVELNYRVLNTIIDFNTATIMSRSTVPKDVGVITTRDVIVGLPFQGIPSVDLSTSVGFLKHILRDYNIKLNGKRGIYGEIDHVDFDSKLALMIEEMVESNDKTLRQGHRMLNIYMGCLKDELKDEGNRMFCASDFLFLLHCKRYLGFFAAWVYTNRLRNGIAIGVNQYTEWLILYLLLTGINMYGICGDFRKYDKKLLLIFISATRHLYRAYYGDSDPEANKVRDLLFEDFLETIHCFQDGDVTVIYKWLHGNTSGNFLTGIINSVAGIVIMYYVICHIIICGLNNNPRGILDAEPKDLPLKYIALNTVSQHGGDDVVTFTRVPGVNFFSVQSAVKLLTGMDYTDDQKGKSGCEIEPLTHIFKCTFLGRGFLFIRDRMCCPLRLYSVLEMTQWNKGKVDKVIMILNCEKQLLELSYHPDIYNKLVSKIKNECFRLFGDYPRFTTWEVAFNNVVGKTVELYTPSIQLKALIGEEVIESVLGKGLSQPK
jgi:hypothetical protein